MMRLIIIAVQFYFMYLINCNLICGGGGGRECTTNSTQLYDGPPGRISCSNKTITNTTPYLSNVHYCNQTKPPPIVHSTDSTCDTAIKQIPHQYYTVPMLCRETKPPLMLHGHRFNVRYCHQTPILHGINLDQHYTVPIQHAILPSNKSSTKTTRYRLKTSTNTTRYRFNIPY